MRSSLARRIRPIIARCRVDLQQTGGTHPGWLTAHYQYGGARILLLQGGQHANIGVQLGIIVFPQALHKVLMKDIYSVLLLGAPNG